jgi:hypothetical protein
MTFSERSKKPPCSACGEGGFYVASQIPFRLPLFSKPETAR